MISRYDDCNDTVRAWCDVARRCRVVRIVRFESPFDAEMIDDETGDALALVTRMEFDPIVPDRIPMATLRLIDGSEVRVVLRMGTKPEQPITES